MLVLAFCFKLDDQNPAKTPLIYVSHPYSTTAAILTYACQVWTAIFTAVYSLTAGPAPFTIAAEVFPITCREVGLAVSVMVNFTLCAVVVIFFPWLSRGSTTGGLGLFVSSKGITIRLLAEN
jgi:hypothetical protein